MDILSWRNQQYRIVVGMKFLKRKWDKKSVMGQNKHQSIQDIIRHIKHCKSNNDLVVTYTIWKQYYTYNNRLFRERGTKTFQYYAREKDWNGQNNKCTYNIKYRTIIITPETTGIILAVLASSRPDFLSKPTQIHTSLHTR